MDNSEHTRAQFDLSFLFNGQKEAEVFAEKPIWILGYRFVVIESLKFGSNPFAPPVFLYEVRVTPPEGEPFWLDNPSRHYESEAAALFKILKYLGTLKGEMYG